MRKLIVPDFNRTQNIDPESARMDFEIALFESRLTETEGAEADELTEVVGELKALREEYEASDGRKFNVTIGYIPPSRLTEIRHMALDYSDLERTSEKAGLSADMDRETVRWGLKGWDLENADGPVEFTSDNVKVGRRDVAVASDLAVATIEAMDWLRGLAKAIHEFNSLSKAEKKR